MVPEAIEVRKAYLVTKVDTPPEGEGRFSAIVSVFGNVDSQGDVIDKGAFAATLTDLERAARFLYLQRTSFGGKVNGRVFGTSTMNPARFDLTKLVPMLEAIHERLSPVVIECLSWQDCIKKYDRPGSLFYLDPPYHGCENDYGKGMFDRGEFVKIAEALRQINGRFIMSINDVPDIRRLFGNFTIIEAPTTYQLPGANNAKKVTELVITNI